jgi:hypothetical protein
MISVPGEGRAATLSYSPAAVIPGPASYPSHTAWRRRTDRIRRVDSADGADI